MPDDKPRRAISLSFSSYGEAPHARKIAPSVGEIQDSSYEIVGYSYDIVGYSYDIVGWFLDVAKFDREHVGLPDDLVG